MDSSTHTSRAYLDAQVRGLLAARVGRPPHLLALAALTWALDPARAIPARSVRASLRRVAPDMTDVTGTSQWPRLVTDARRKVTDAGSTATRRRDSIRAARVTIGLLVITPVVERPVSAVSSRSVAALIAVDILRQLGDGGNGWTTVMASYPELGVRLGVTPRTAETAVRDAIARGWLIKVSGGVGRPGRYRLPATLPADIATVVDDEYYDEVEALADLDITGPLATLLTSVDHAAWDALGRRAWSVAVALAAGVDPVSVMGIGPRASRSMVRDLAQAGLDPQTWTGATVRAALNQVAGAPGPDGGATPAQVRTEAVAAQRAAAQVRAAQVRVFAERRAADHAARPAADRSAAAPMVTERRTVPLPAGYVDQDHRGALEAKVAQAGWTVVLVDVFAGTADLERPGPDAVAA